MMEYFNKSYLRKNSKLNYKEYKDIKITSFQNGFLIKPDFQRPIAISLGFGTILAAKLRDTNSLFTWKEAEEILNKRCTDND